MPKWEYLFVSAGYANVPERINGVPIKQAWPALKPGIMMPQLSAELGEAGWELIIVRDTADSGTTYIFKRPRD